MAYAILTPMGENDEGCESAPPIFGLIGLLNRAIVNDAALLCFHSFHCNLSPSGGGNGPSSTVFSPDSVG